MSTERNLWEVTFIVEGLHLTREQILVGNFRFEKLSEKESRGMWLPARCIVRIRGNSKEVKDVARRSLEDFLGIYSTIGNISPRTLICKETRRIKGRVPEEEGRSRYVVDHIAYMKPLRLVPGWNEEKSSGILNVSETIRNSVNLDSERNLHLRISLDYLLHAGHVERKENKLIDFMVGLEALYIKETQELSYRLSHRVASLLGGTEKLGGIGEERIKIFENVRKLYDKRSKLVHGKTISISWDEVKLAQMYLRESIKRFLSLSQQYSRDRIISELDRGVINERKRRAIQKDSKKLFDESWGTITFK